MYTLKIYFNKLVCKNSFFSCINNIYKLRIKLKFVNEFQPYRVGWTQLPLPQLVEN